MIFIFLSLLLTDKHRVLIAKIGLHLFNAFEYLQMALNKIKEIHDNFEEVLEEAKQIM